MKAATSILAEALRIKKQQPAIKDTNPANPFLDEVLKDQRRPCFSSDRKSFGWNIKKTT
jgi:hypothetical protein